MEGWISIYRKFMEWEWYTDTNTKSLFIHCLLKANYENKTWRGKQINRGQFFTSVNHLSHELGLTAKEIRTAIKKLERTNEIATQGASNGTMITVCKYDDYQDTKKKKGKPTGKPKGEPGGKPTGKQGATTNNDNNNNNKGENIPSLLDFKDYGLENKPNIDLKALELKYKAWKENDWKDGKNKEIKNWKVKLLNTLPYIPSKEKNNNSKDSNLPENQIFTATS